MNKNWKILRDVLERIYEREGISSNFSDDIIHLENAHLKTESMWYNRFAEIDSVKFILLSEAPLFGTQKKTYIYNPEAQTSSFFHFKDVLAFPEITVENLPKNATIKTRKSILFNTFKKHGFIVLDLFPYSFNSIDTSINYRSMSKELYTKIFNLTKDYYFRVKLKLCIAKSESPPMFIYRYNRLLDRVAGIVHTVLKDEIEDEESIAVYCVSGENMSLDRGYLSELISSKCNAA